MADQYEIRENELNPFYPFQVVKNGYAIASVATKPEAEAMIERASQPFDYEIGLNEVLDKYEDKPATETEQKETEDEIVINTQETIGSIIEFHGDKWLVISSEYITSERAEEIEEMHDAYVRPGWDTLIRKVK